MKPINEIKERTKQQCGRCPAVFEYIKGTRARKFCDACITARIRAKTREIQQRGYLRSDRDDFRCDDSLAVRSWQEIGDAMGFSKQRAQQIFAVAVKKMRAHPAFQQAFKEIKGV